MDQPPGVQNPAAFLRVIHLALCTSLTVVGGALAVVQALSVGAPLAETPVAGHILGSLGFLVALLGALVLRRRIPERRPEVPLDTFWSVGETRAGALLAWVVTEGGGILAAIGYYLTASPLGAVGFAAALLLLIGMAPSRLGGS